MSNKANKTNSEKKNSLFFFYIRLQKQHNSLMYWLKICKAWVTSQLRWAWNCLKLNVTSSNVLRITIHWLSACKDFGLTQGSLIPKKHSHIMEARSGQNHDNKIAPQVNFNSTVTNIMDLLCIFVITKQYLFQRLSNHF